MIYITGDTHGEFDEFMNRLAKYNLNPDDTVIVCGDFGFVWGDPYHNAILKELTKLDFTICFVAEYTVSKKMLSISCAGRFLSLRGRASSHSAELTAAINT